MFLRFNSKDSVEVVFSHYVSSKIYGTHTESAKVRDDVSAKLVETIFLFKDDGKFYRNVEFVARYKNEPEATFNIEGFVQKRNISILYEREIAPSEEDIVISEAEAVLLPGKVHHNKFDDFIIETGQALVFGRWHKEGRDIKLEIVNT